MTTSIGFIGAGQMARALAQGFVQAGHFRGADICLSDPVAAARDGFTSAVPGARPAANAAEVVEGADLVVLAVKPQHVDQVGRELQQAIVTRPLFVSILAGVTVGRLSAALGTDRIVRVMPNTPCLIGVGAAGFCCSASVRAEEKELVRKLLSSIGLAFEVGEHLLDAVTGLSGSGPAFIYQVIEALSDGGVRVGLPRDVATRLAAQTVRGAAEMVLQTGEHPATLKDKVTSPGGTTIAGIQALEEGALRATLIRAVVAATERSRQLGQADAS
jgi:pyrroline-5-carboxylate reductase